MSTEGPYTLVISTYRALTDETKKKIHRALQEQGDLGVWLVEDKGQS